MFNPLCKSSSSYKQHRILTKYPGIISDSNAPNLAEWSIRSYKTIYHATIAPSEPLAGGGEGAGGGAGSCRDSQKGYVLEKSRLKGGEEMTRLTSNLVFSAIILCIPIPTPSITASNIPHPIAEFLAAFIPPRIASAPPVKNPAITTLLSAFTHQISSHSPSPYSST